MFQLAFVATLFRLSVRGPSFRPLLQLPNRRATARGVAGFIPCYYLIFLLIYAGSFRGEDPRSPLCCVWGRTNRWKQKYGGAEVPAGIRGNVVQIERARTSNQAVVAITEPKGDRRDTCVYI